MMRTGVRRGRREPENKDWARGPRPGRVRKPTLTVKRGKGLQGLCARPACPGAGALRMTPPVLLWRL